MDELAREMAALKLRHDQLERRFEQEFERYTSSLRSWADQLDQDSQDPGMSIFTSQAIAEHSTVVVRFQQQCGQLSQDQKELRQAVSSLSARLPEAHSSNNPAHLLPGPSGLRRKSVDEHTTERAKSPRLSGGVSDGPSNIVVPQIIPPSPTTSPLGVFDQIFQGLDLNSREDKAEAMMRLLVADPRISEVEKEYFLSFSTRFNESISEWLNKTTHATILARPKCMLCHWTKTKANMKSTYVDDCTTCSKEDQPFCFQLEFLDGVADGYDPAGYSAGAVIDFQLPSLTVLSGGEQKRWKVIRHLRKAD